MPILNVTLSSTPDAVLAARIAATLSQLTEQILQKDAALTSVAIAYVAPEHWFVAGQALAEQRLTSFFLNILVTDETNTGTQKAAYIAAVFGAMADLLGPLHDVSYIHVHDVRAGAWGYGGSTQQVRAVKKMLA